MENGLMVIDELNNIQKICEKLMASKHYQKMGPDGVMAIVHKAMSLGVHPMDALNGGMYFVQGRVEMSAILMARLIRQQKHSITMDKTSTDKICILHGRRVDNGDTWKASFSVDDAKRAGLLKGGSPWEKYPDIMCYNRALSKLARQLFPDVIGNCYVEGEISDTIKDGVTTKIDELDGSEEVKETITQLQADRLNNLIGDDDNFRSVVMDFVQKRFGSADFLAIRSDSYGCIFDKVFARCGKKVPVENTSESESLDQSTVSVDTVDVVN
jgi:hypothetical protein